MISLGVFGVFYFSYRSSFSIVLKKDKPCYYQYLLFSRQVKIPQPLLGLQKSSEAQSQQNTWLHVVLLLYRTGGTVS